MDNNFKKFLEEKSGCTPAAMCMMIAEPEGVNAKAILWDVMCAINREGRKGWVIFKTRYYIRISFYTDSIANQCFDDEKAFYFKEHNNSELKALTAALQYIFKESTK